MASKRILVVDDEMDIRELLNFTLSKEGYDVISTGNGNDAIPMIEKHAPDLVILDGMLPGMDGNDICYKLKNNKACGEDLILNEMLKSGANILLLSLSKLFNLILRNHKFPSK